MKIFLAVLAVALANLTYSPDGSKMAYTVDNDLYVKDAATQVETRLTFDGSETILNGYASWLYYEEILGRSSNYKAFWWSPDSRKIAFYRFDDSNVDLFPIFSAAGQRGSLKMTRYPKAGRPNPVVKIGMIDLSNPSVIVWADFEYNDDQYFGTPFWGADSKELFVQWEPRSQKILELYSVSALTGYKRLLFREQSDTWTEFKSGMLFGKKGLYFTSEQGTGWQQICYLSYDGKKFNQKTTGQNWDVRLIDVNEKLGDLWFIAKRDVKTHPCLYRLDKKGRITNLTNEFLYTTDAKIFGGGKRYTATVGTASIRDSIVIGDATKANPGLYKIMMKRKVGMNEPCPDLMNLNLYNGMTLSMLVTLPRGYDKTRKYPLLMQVYGGPGTAYVRDRWNDRDATDRWCWENGIIYVVADPRTSGANGRDGMKQSYRNLLKVEPDDYISCLKFLTSFLNVDCERVGVEGFSFGGTTTATLVLKYPQYFCCGIAGGGVYDWTLYDSNYTERFMQTPEKNPDGYESTSVVRMVERGEVDKAYRPGSLMLTHGTGDDNVHFQNTLQLVNALQEKGIDFELMIYPDGMHGYRGAQKEYSLERDHEFWKKWLLKQ